MNDKKYYISTAIAYTSSKPHIGNTYEIVLADAIARYKRLDGYDVYFQTGTDEHGEKIELKAKEQGDEETMELDEGFMGAMEQGMPPISGLGFGIDRLMMLFLEQESIRDVLLFPTMKERN